MRISQINTNYKIGSTGVIVAQIQDLCKANYIDCEVVCTQCNLPAPTDVYLMGNTVSFILHALLTRIGGKHGYFSFISTLKLLKHYDRQLPDVIHLHNLHTYFINLPLLLRYASKKNIPVVVTLHDCWFFTGGCCHYAAIGCDRWKSSCGNCPKRKQEVHAHIFDGTKQTLRDRYSLFGGIKKLFLVGVSNWITNEAKQGVFNNAHCLTVHNGVDLNVFKPTKSDMAENLDIKGKFIILGPASKWLLPENETAFNYFVNNLSKDEVLVLFGCRTKKPDLPEHIIQYDFTSNQAELAELYSMANVFVNLTHEESLSLINIEAQACGTQVVTYRNTGAKETVDGTFSKTVETNDYKELLSTVREIKASQKSAYCKECVEFVKKNFNKEVNYGKYIELYNQIQSEK